MSCEIAQNRSPFNGARRLPTDDVVLFCEDRHLAGGHRSAVRLQMSTRGELASEGFFNLRIRRHDRRGW
jgi:hypothetical protein